MKPTSPYSNTPTIKKYVEYLDVLVLKEIESSIDDEVYILESKYNQRPDLLAYDLYGTSRLWWVFAVRNPDVLIDPVRDMSTGIEIFLPSKKIVDNL
jgi:hypothetical protein